MRTRAWRILGPLLAVANLGAAPEGGNPARPADPLLKLVPADVALTIVVEDLKTHAKAFFDSPLQTDLAALPAVRAWVESPKGREFRQAKKQIASILKADFVTIRDALLGEAAVLALRIPPGGRPDDARGLLLTRMGDRELFGRMVAILNESQTKKGELLRVSERPRGSTRYSVREFQPGKKADEYYAVLDNGVFAWSNSEELIQGVIDRQASGESGLVQHTRFQTLRRKLPPRAVVSAFVDPRVIERLVIETARQTKPSDQRLLSLIGRYLTSVNYAGASVEWRDGIVANMHELIDPSKLSDGMRRWAVRAESPDGSLMRVPRSALAFATADVDFGVLLDAFSELVPEQDRSKRDNLLLAVNGILLGLDLRSEVIPQMGPGMAAYLEFDGSGPSVVLEAQVQSGTQGRAAEAALANALRTLLAVHSLDPKNGDGKLKLEKRDEVGSTIVSLTPTTPFSFATPDGRLILGTSPKAVSGALAARADETADGRIVGLSEVFFPGHQSFACVDLPALYRAVEPRREAVARRMATRQNRSEPEAARDLDQVLALIRPFDAAFFTSKVEPGFEGVHRSLGLVKLPSASRADPRDPTSSR